MDVFALHRQMLGDYAADARSFIRIADDRISRHVDEGIRNGLLWPDPLLQLNPSFEPGAKQDGCLCDETPEELAELQRHFPAPRDAVAYIMETFPPGPPTDAHGNFIPMSQWAPNNWPPHIHPPKGISE